MYIVTMHSIVSINCLLELFHNNYGYSLITLVHIGDNLM